MRSTQSKPSRTRSTRRSWLHSSSSSLGCAARNPGQCRHDQLRGGAGRHVDAHPALQRLRRLQEQRLQLVELAEQPLAALVQQLAVGRRLHLARRAMQQPRAERVLELLHGRRHARLRQPELLGRAREARELDHLDEDRQRVEPLQRMARPALDRARRRELGRGASSGRHCYRCAEQCDWRAAVYRCEPHQ
jgi:hypothetical protein